MFDWQTIVKNVIDGVNRLRIVPGIGNPYKQFTFVIPDDGIETLFYSFNYFRILTISATTGVSIRFGSSGTPTDVIGAGIGYKLPDTVDRAQIINESGGALTITVAVAVGEIFDDRLNISGNINVVNAAGTTLEVHETLGNTIATVSDVSMTAGATTQLSFTSSTRRTIIVKNLDAALSIRIGNNSTATRGHRLDPGESLVLDTTATVNGFNPNGVAVSCSVFTISD